MQITNHQLVGLSIAPLKFHVALKEETGGCRGKHLILLYYYQLMFLWSHNN